MVRPCTVRVVRCQPRERPASYRDEATGIRRPAGEGSGSQPSTSATLR